MTIGLAEHHGALGFILLFVVVVDVAYYAFHRTSHRVRWLWATHSAHHRVHHACNPERINHNFGGALIVWDRMFGSYAHSDRHAPLRYGIDGVSPRYNALAIAFAEWRQLLTDMHRAGGPIAAVRTALSRPRAA
ncbi:MAG: Fatty acid hydroxylase superfamily protein [Hydrocarboniphaga sp.]|uniref:sterol desaturase family protein n=1 Tax=Hydrocarboniphaga sp. TaxID=2033016 RepID=UPI0026019603|nr:hypothetical protein [Hydrocarboniphaga sp.]MDB5970851.1 Fatty acid hydroxylase superfamily protein [Hydrocarboniphaga sp.]